MKKRLYGIIFSIALISFTLYIVLNTFVLSNSYQVIDDEPKVDIPTPTEQEIIFTDTQYKDENIEINITTDRYKDTTIYMADVKVNDIRYLKTAFAKDTFGKNVSQVTSKIASKHNAILAVNGDFYGVQERGYVLKNYKIYRSTTRSNQEDLVIDKYGNFSIIEEKKTKLTDLVDAKEVLAFGPALLMDGKIDVTKNQEVAKARATNPRCAIAQLGELHYLFLVSDGRTKKSKGLSLYDLAKYLQKMDIKIAYNLDGGGSATFYFNGHVVNQPTHNGKDIEERKVSDIVYIGY